MIIFLNLKVNAIEKTDMQLLNKQKIKRMGFKMKICCLGDSLTEGDYGIYGKSGIGNVHAENYPYYLHLFSGAQVMNFGKCGYTSSSYLNFYDEGNVDLNGCDIIIIMLGTNGGLDPAGDTKENADFETLIDRCRRDCPDAEIVLCTPPHVTENPEYSNCGYAERVKKAVKWVREKAKSDNIKLIDVAGYDLFCDENEHIMQPNDGLHFGKTGYINLAAYIYDGLSEFSLI